MGIDFTSPVGVPRRVVDFLGCGAGRPYELCRPPADTKTLQSPSATVSAHPGAAQAPIVQHRRHAGRCSLTFGFFASNLFDNTLVRLHGLHISRVHVRVQKTGWCFKTLCLQPPPSATVSVRPAAAQVPVVQHTPRGGFVVGAVAGLVHAACLPAPQGRFLSLSCPPGGSREGQDCHCPEEIGVFWADSGPDPGGNILLIFIFAPSAAGG
jgi:hypothetical protein